MTTIAVGAALLVGAAGCGGGGSDDSTSTAKAKPLTEQAFIKQADAICAKGQKSVEDKYKAFLKENGIKEIGKKGEPKAEAEKREEEVVETIALPELRAQIEQLQELGVPTTVEVRAVAYFEAAEAGIEKAEEDPQLLFDSPGKIFAESDKHAREIGFEVCGNR